MKAKFLYLPIFLLILMSACSNETEDRNNSLGREYFPLEQGKYVIYESDSIVVDDGGTKTDTFRSFIKEEIGETFEDLEGKEANKIYRSFKRNISDKWELTDVWTAQLTDFNAQKTEENLRFVKFIFPPALNAKWNGNAYIVETEYQEIAGEPIKIYEGRNSKIVETGEDFTVNNLYFENTVLVEQADFETAISIREAWERYAPNVGLVHKYMRIYDSQNSDGTVEWEKRAEAGFIHTLKILEHN
jgi:bifunctional DNA-binding transcriptional regulator/antitoxin component of YhaV-PrlF toxin-antitoxin module